MEAPGHRRPAGATGRPPGPSRSTRRRLPRSLPASIALALGLAVLAAVGWAILRGVFELGPGLVVLATLVGWGIGVVIRAAAGPAFAAVGIAALAWLLGLVGSWLVSMAILPASSRTFLERIEATPFLDFIGPQLGVLEWGGLLAYVLAAAYGARRSASTRP